MTVPPESRKPRVPPTYQRQLGDVSALMERAFGDADVTAVIARARQVVDQLQEEPEGPGADALASRLVDDAQVAVGLLALRNDKLLNVFGRSGLQRLVMAAVIDGLEMQPLQLRALPGIPGRALRLLEDGARVEAMKQELAPGQIWVDATALTVTQYRELWGAVSYNQIAGLDRELGTPGRPRGSLTSVRAELISQLRSNGQWSDQAIYAQGLQLGLWTDEGPYAANPDRNRKRVQRIRKAAGVPKKNPPG